MGPDGIIGAGRSVAALRGSGGGDSSPPPILKSRQKLSMKNGIKLVGCTIRLKNYVKIPPFLSDLSEVAPPLRQVHAKMKFLFFDLRWISIASQIAPKNRVLRNGVGQGYHSPKTVAFWQICRQNLPVSVTFDSKSPKFSFRR